MTSQRGAGVRDRSTLRLVITRSVALRNTLIINKGAERTRLIMDIHTGAQTKNEKRVWPLLAAAGMLHARWSGSRRTLATTAAVRVLVVVVVAVRVVAASTVGRVSLRVVFLLLHEQRARSKVGAGGVAPSPPPPPPPAPHASALASSWRA